MRQSINHSRILTADSRRLIHVDDDADTEPDTIRA